MAQHLLLDRESVFCSKVSYFPLISNAQREEQIRKEQDRLELQRKKEEERVRRDRLREQERIEKEQKKEAERLEKESIRVRVNRELNLVSSDALADDISFFTSLSFFFKLFFNSLKFASALFGVAAFAKNVI